MARFDETQLEEAEDLFSQGYSVMDVYRHLGAKANGRESEISIEQDAAKRAIAVAPENRNASANQSLLSLVMNGSSKLTEAIGLGDATKVFGRDIARTRLGAKATGGDYETNLQYVEPTTTRERAGAVMQTGATVGGLAVAPAGILPAAIAGGALGYAYDVGGDLLHNSSLEETLTPGVGTAVGVIAPPAIGGIVRGVATLGKGMQTKTKVIANDIGSALSSAKGKMGELEIPNTISGVYGSVKDRLGRAVSRGKESLEATAEKNIRLKNATPAQREAIKTGLKDNVIDYVSNADEQTKTVLREMVEMAEQPKGMRGGVRPTRVASDKAVEQFEMVAKEKQRIGQEIGKLSDEFSPLRDIDVTPTQNYLMDVLRQNGLEFGVDGKVFARDNMRITDEQLTVINKLFDKITQQNNVSAKNLHELDQWFSAQQRTSRLVDKIQDVFVEVPTTDGGKTQANLFKVFRDAFGQRLDEVAPDNLRVLNRQYRQFSGLIDDLEGSLIRDPDFGELVGKEIFSEAGLRQIFGEGVKAGNQQALYNALDRVSRELGYSGPRADELYLFGNELRNLYPETIPDTGFRGNVSTSITDVIGSVIKTGKPGVKDQQRALKKLLEEGKTASRQIEKTASKTSVSVEKPVTKPVVKKNTLNDIPENLRPLAEEAKKYKSAEEFVEASANSYHGTPGKEFDNFVLDATRNTSNETAGLGVWVTNNPDVAKNFSRKIDTGMFGVQANSTDVGGTVMPVVTTLKNPKIYTATKGSDDLLEEIARLEKERPTQTRARLEEDRFERQRLYDKIEEIDSKIDSLKKQHQRDAFENMMDERDQFVTYIQPKVKWQQRYSSMNTDEANKNFVDYLKSQGHDGIVIKGTEYDAGGTGVIDQIVSFEPENVLTRKQLTDLYNQVHGKVE